MKSLVYILSIFQFAFLLSCENESSINQSLKINRALYYDFITDENPNKTFDYQYDKKGRIEKISVKNFKNQLFEYEQYFYNKTNQIINIKKYNLDYDSWALHDSSSFEYYNGHLIKEEKFFANSSYNSRIIYEYVNSNLKKKFEFRNTILYLVTNYEYDNNLLIREDEYTDSLCVNQLTYTINTYEEKKITLTEKYGYGGKIQQIAYTYNNDEDLIIIESIQLNPLLQINLNYVIRYEYALVP